MKKTCSRRAFLRHSFALAAGSAVGVSIRSQASGSQPEADDLLSEELYCNPRIAIIIDDVGYNKRRLMPFLDLGIPLTFSILPHLPYSRRLAEIIYARGHEIMLHQPMEPYDRSIDPGPGALYLDQSTGDLVRVVEDNIRSFPYASGMNNHMGSRFTESREKVLATLKIFRDRDFYFVDSFTTSHSVAFDTAIDLNMTAACRNVFIDNVWDTHYICSQLRKLKRYARRFGHGIGIGHPRPETVNALESFVDELSGSGFVFTYASRMVCV